MRKAICRAAVIVAAAVLSLGFTAGSATADISWPGNSADVHGGK